MRRLLLACALFPVITSLEVPTASAQSCDADCAASIPGGTVTQCGLKLEKGDGWSRKAAVVACIALHDQCLSACNAPQEAALKRSTAPLFQFAGPKPPEKVDISWIQETLNSLGYSAGRVDGKYGARTKAAIEEFERSHGFAVTGKPSVNLQRHIAWTAAPFD